jgi:hypothetical protein
MPEDASIKRIRRWLFAATKISKTPSSNQDRFRLTERARTCKVSRSLSRLVRIRSVRRAVQFNEPVRTATQTSELIIVGTLPGIAKIDLVRKSIHASDEEGDVRVSEVTLLLRDLVEMGLVWKIAHLLARMDPIEKLRVGREGPRDRATEQFSANLRLQCSIHR